MTRLNDIVTTACNLQKVDKMKKQDAMDLIMMMIESEEIPTDFDLARLYSFFIPNLPAFPKTPLEWLRKSIAGPSEVRYYLGYIYKDGSTVVSTDGHRMHMVESDNIPEMDTDGFYNELGVKVDVDGKYPEWQRVTPKSDKSLTVNLKDCECKPVVSIGEAVNICGDAWVSRKYLKDAIGRTDTFTILNSEGCTNGKTAVLIQCEHGQAVVMPCLV